MHDRTVTEHLGGDTRIPVLVDAALEDVVGTGHPGDAIDRRASLRGRITRRLRE